MLNPMQFIPLSDEAFLSSISSRKAVIIRRSDGTEFLAPIYRSRYGPIAIQTGPNEVMDTWTLFTFQLLLHSGEISLVPHS